jgi:hypothetical protein
MATVIPHKDEEGKVTFEKVDSPVEAALREKARKAIEAEEKKRQEAALYNKILDEEKAKVDRDLELEEVLINIPAFAAYLTIDGVRLHHGEVKSMTHARAMSVREQMARMWEQENLSGNPNLKDYKPIKTSSFSARSLGSAV